MAIVVAIHIKETVVIIAETDINVIKFEVISPLKSLVAAGELQWLSTETRT